MRVLAIFIAAALFTHAIGSLIAAEFTVEKTDRGAIIKQDGQLVAEYLTKSGNKPVLYPLIGPGGKRMTRGFPIEPQAGETDDHIHQRGLWFTHGDVNGVVFWNQEPNAGTIEHREFTALDGGTTARVATRNDWLAPNGDKVCSDARTFVFSAEPPPDNAASGNDAARLIDVEVKVQAGAGDVKFGDTKEGSFGVRTPDSMRLDARAGGQIVNSAGQTNDSAWGQPADWVDYHGPVDGETLGLAILNHPASFGYPTRWHVRGYGLFAANPFGAKSFDPALPEGGYILPAGKSLVLRYRVILHRGNAKDAKIQQRFADYAKTE